MFRIIKSLSILIFVFLIGYFFGIKEVRFYEIVSSSMSPTLEIGDKIISIKPSNLARKDIVVLISPEGSEILTKRIIGLPGEKLKIEDGYVFINGEKINEPYIKEKPIYTVEEIKIDENSYFLLGDNRNESEDSSVWGPIKREKIIGKVVLRYYPFSKFKIF